MESTENSENSVGRIFVYAPSRPREHADPRKAYWLVGEVKGQRVNLGRDLEYATRFYRSAIQGERIAYRKKDHNGNVVLTQTGQPVIQTAWKGLVQIKGQGFVEVIFSAGAIIGVYQKIPLFLARDDSDFALELVEGEDLSQDLQPELVSEEPVS